MKFSIIINAFNEGEKVRQTVDYLLLANKEDKISQEIIISDDGSSDKSCDFLKQDPKYKEVKYLRHEKEGIAIARNRGAAIAKGDFLIFLDAHMIVEKGWLKRYEKTLIENPHIKTLGSRVYDSDAIGSRNTFHLHSFRKTLYSQKGQFAYDQINIKQEAIYKTPFLAGACAGVYKDVFQEIGGYPEFMMRWGHEEIYFSMILYYYGYTSYIDANNHIGHYFKSGTKKSEGMESERYENVDFNIYAMNFITLNEEYWNKYFVLLRRKTKANVEKIQYLFKQNKNKILHCKKQLEKNRKRILEDYLEEFYSLLPAFYQSDFEFSLLSESSKEETLQTLIKLKKEYFKHPFISIPKEKTDDYLAALNFNIALSQKKNFLNNEAYESAIDALKYRSDLAEIYFLIIEILPSTNKAGLAKQLEPFLSIIIKQFNNQKQDKTSYPEHIGKRNINGMKAYAYYLKSFYEQDLNKALIYILKAINLFKAKGYIKHLDNLYKKQLEFKIFD